MTDGHQKNNNTKANTWVLINRELDQDNTHSY
jgi:hypothetical protein